MSLRSLADEMDAAPHMSGVGHLSPIRGGSVPKSIRATPYRWQSPDTLPRRPWIYGRQLLRGSAFVVIAPGATGKSSLLAGMALSLCTGRPYLGQQVWDGPQRVWLWNLEDPLDELTRSIQGAALHWGASEADIDGRLFVDSGMEGATLRLARMGREGPEIDAAVADGIVAELLARQVDVLTVDPFVSSHGLSDENDNAAMDMVAKQWGRIAKAANCSVVLVHHSKKLNGADVTMESSRGASSLGDAARGGLALNTMKPEEACIFGIAPDKRRQFFRADDAKPNRAPAGSGDWYEMVSSFLGNGPNGGDSVGVATPWSPPDPFEDVSATHLYEAQQRIGVGEWGANPQSGKWAGQAVADVIGADIGEASGKAKVKHILETWTKAGRFRVERRKDVGKGREIPFLVVGEAVDPNDLPT